MRTFIAIDLSKEIRNRLEEVTRVLKEKLKSAPIRWVPVDNIHLTLKFLGEISPANIEILKESMQAGLAGSTQFDFSVGKIGAFPSIKKPRVIWVGVEAPVELKIIQAMIESCTKRLGYVQEDHEFSPHLTLGRIAREKKSLEIASICQVLQSTPVGFLGVDRVREICLYKSDLTRTGSIYTKIWTAKLLNKAS